MDRRGFLEALPAVALGAKTRFASGSRLRMLVPAAGPFAGASVPAASPSTDVLAPVPSSVPDVRQPVIDLGGEWRTTSDPPSEFWRPETNTSSWKSIRVPSELTLEGIDILQNVEYPCRRKIAVPADYAGHRIFLRFDGVYSYARVWVNGTFLRNHYGGFTSWDCEITAQAPAGSTADLVVGVTDRSDDISQASYYAKHLIGGILRGVTMFVVPAAHLEAFSVTSSLDANYKDGLMHLEGQFSQDAQRGELRLGLKGPSGEKVPLSPAVLHASPEGKVSGEVHVTTPKAWDAEHPNLYSLEITAIAAGKTVQTLDRRIGFRTVERKGNELQVNGRPVKLRGACRHSTHPLYGRAVPPEFDRRDARLFRAANFNFVRTSHYPPTEEFLAACDLNGIYVEEETAVCWSKVDQGPSSDPAFSGRFMSQFREMIGRDRGHPSILFWSLANESEWGTNLALEYHFAREHDPERPLIFSFPDTVPFGVEAYDIYSKHYPGFDSGLESDRFPLLNDEYAHIPCYCVETLLRDPGVRNFWGESIARFGDHFLVAEGCLGGAIWAGIDDIFLLPEKPVGYGPWGVIDGWRRPKPEYWLAKKAYSPIRIDDRPLPNPGAGKQLSIPIANAFDHTSLDEIDIRWSVGGEGGRLSETGIAPHASGFLRLPARDWREGEIVDLRFAGANHELIDRFLLPIGEPSYRPSTLPSVPAILKTSGDQLRIEGGKIQVALSRATGLLTRAALSGKPLIAGGPYLDLGTGPLLSYWILRSCDASVRGNTVVIRTAGECKLQRNGIQTLPVTYEIEIDGNGEIITRYRVDAKQVSGTHLGISYLLAPGVDRLSWKRKPLWSVYPKDHIGRPEGTAPRIANHLLAPYRTEPKWSWSEDMEDAFLSGNHGVSFHGTNDFRSIKENIWFADCIFGAGGERVRAEADADLAVRAGVLPDQRVAFSLYNFWSYPEIVWGNYTGAKHRPVVSSQTARLRLTGKPGNSDD